MASLDVIDRRLLSLLICPRDHSGLDFHDGYLRCLHGHRYPVIHGVPILILPEKEQTIGIALASLKAGERGAGAPLYVDTLGISDAEKRGVEQSWNAHSKTDPVISYLVGATSGWGYLSLIGSLETYPIPNIPIRDGEGQLLLDVGSSWGRWCVSAARKGWCAVGIDPSLGAILAAKRAFSEFGLDLLFVCGDARFLPFKDNLFKCAFSYSVIQHFSKKDAELALTELGRVLCHDGFAKVQLAHRGGMRSIYSRKHPGYQNAGVFRVRYWSLVAMRDVFERAIGQTTLLAEGFGGLGLLYEDFRFVSAKAKVLIIISKLLKTLSVVVRPLLYVADSVYVVSTKTDASSAANKETTKIRD